VISEACFATTVVLDRGSFNLLVTDAVHFIVLSIVSIRTRLTMARCVPTPDILTVETPGLLTSMTSYPPGRMMIIRTSFIQVIRINLVKTILLVEVNLEFSTILIVPEEEVEEEVVVSTPITTLPRDKAPLITHQGIRHRMVQNIKDSETSTSSTMDLIRKMFTNTMKPMTSHIMEEVMISLIIGVIIILRMLDMVGTLIKIIEVTKSPTTIAEVMEVMEVTEETLVLKGGQIRDLHPPPIMIEIHPIKIMKM